MHGGQHNKRISIILVLLVVFLSLYNRTSTNQQIISLNGNTFVSEETNENVDTCQQQPPTIKPGIPDWVSPINQYLVRNDTLFVNEWDKTLSSLDISDLTKPTVKCTTNLNIETEVNDREFLLISNDFLYSLGIALGFILK